MEHVPQGMPERFRLQGFPGRHGAWPPKVPQAFDQPRHARVDVLAVDEGFMGFVQEQIEPILRVQHGRFGQIAERDDLLPPVAQHSDGRIDGGMLP